MSVKEGKRTQRTCFCCRKVLDKVMLLRLVVDDEGQIWPDFSAKLPGRGVYLCLEVVCLSKMSDKRLQVLRRDFSPQLPQWQVLQQRLSDMLGLRFNQLLSGMKRQAVIGRDAVMHQMWDRKPLLILFASDAGDALLRQVKDAVEKREDGKSLRTKVLMLALDAKSLGLALGREKVSVVAFLKGSPQEKLWQLCVWQQELIQAGVADKRESKVTDGE
ncbi:MAG: DUF448 domain-containing protein [Ghiorsea sp.]|nr:DUF448 domain-containing protein [Ghiorsea sp.]